MQLNKAISIICMQRNALAIPKMSTFEIYPIKLLAPPFC